MSLRLAASTNAYTRHTLEEAIARIGSRGVEGVEILADAPHAFPLPIPPDRLAAIRALGRERGLAVANVNANTARGFFKDAPDEPFFEPSITSPIRAHREWRIAHTRAAIDLAAALGSPSVSLTTGRPLADPAESFRFLVDSLDEILAHAEEKGVRVGIEYEPGLLVENARELVRLLDDMNHPALAANLDLTHVHVNGEDVRRVARALGERIAHVHAADARGRKHYHLVPGEGDIDWARALDALESVGYRGFVTLELYTYAHAPDEAIDAGVKHLQRARADPWPSSSPTPT